MSNKLETLKEELRTLSEAGASIEISKADADLLDVTNVYDELEESEVTNG